MRGRLRTESERGKGVSEEKRKYKKKGFDAAKHFLYSPFRK